MVNNMRNNTVTAHKDGDATCDLCNDAGAAGL
jgi:hypothetical protein